MDAVRNKELAKKANDGELGPRAPFLPLICLSIASNTFRLHLLGLIFKKFSLLNKPTEKCILVENSVL